MSADPTTPPPQPRRRVRLQPEARREQIIREATRLIGESGFNAVSLADVAQACDIRKPSVLHYFPSMHHLLEGVLRQRDVTDFVEAGDAALPPADPPTARAYFTRLFEHNLGQREIISLYAILGVEAIAPSHPAHAYFVERIRLARESLPGVLSWKADPETAAVELLAFWQGLEVELLRDPDLDARAVWNHFCDRFFA